MAVDRSLVTVVVEGDRVEVYPRAGEQSAFVEAAKAATGAGLLLPAARPKKWRRMKSPIQGNI